MLDKLKKKKNNKVYSKNVFESFPNSSTRKVFRALKKQLIVSRVDETRCTESVSDQSRPSTEPKRDVSAQITLWIFYEVDQIAIGAHFPSKRKKKPKKSPERALRHLIDNPVLFAPVRTLLITKRVTHNVHNSFRNT